MKPFDVICIKPFNTRQETSAWGCLELLKIYRITGISCFENDQEVEKKRKGVLEIDGVEKVDKNDTSNYNRKFVVATHEKFQDDDSVPIFREHLKKL